VLKIGLFSLLIAKGEKSAAASASAGGWLHGVADWRGGMPACSTAGPNDTIIK